MLQLQAKYDASETVISLGLSGYVLGFSLGPILCEYFSVEWIIWGWLNIREIGGEQRVYEKGRRVLLFMASESSGPMSEMYGRRLPYLISWPLLVGKLKKLNLFQYNKLTNRSILCPKRLRW